MILFNTKFSTRNYFPWPQWWLIVQKAIFPKLFVWNFQKWWCDVFVTDMFLVLWQILWFVWRGVFEFTDLINDGSEAKSGESASSSPPPRSHVPPPSVSCRRQRSWLAALWSSNSYSDHPIVSNCYSDHPIVTPIISILLEALFSIHITICFKTSYLISASAYLASTSVQSVFCT